MSKLPLKPIGLIEGFYGNSWSLAERLKFPKYLAELGLNTYIYCPKSDVYLRKRWHEDWPLDNWKELIALSSECQENNICFGIGLSPYETYHEYSSETKLKLRTKISRILELSPKFMCVLFDDMRGNIEGIATLQAQIANDISLWSHPVKVLFCPTYYSFDPILQSTFGKKPDAYGETLGRLLSPEIGVFWTGNQVCSDKISIDHITLANDMFDRQVTLWDNYSANDGKQRSEHLYLDGLPDRDSRISDYIEGHLCNAMTQSELMLITLAGLSELHDKLGHVSIWLEDKLGKDLLNLIQRDLFEFRSLGRVSFSQDRQEELIEDYRAINSMAAKQIASWLDGRYQFDPSCLTE